MIVSTSGKMIRHRIDYHSKVDAFDNTTYKELPRPVVLHQAFRFLPLIDEANKERQSTLALEKNWRTKNCWTRVITSLVGEYVVDMMRLDRHKRAGLPIIFRTYIQDFDILEMADMMWWTDACNVALRPKCGMRLGIFFGSEVPTTPSSIHGPGGHR